MKSLSRPKIDILEGGIERAKEKLGLVMRQVQTFLDLRTIVCAGPFLYAVIQEGTPDSNIFGHPNWLALLAHATLRAHVTVSGGKKTQNLPLVLSAPLDTTKGKSTSEIIFPQKYLLPYLCPYVRPVHNVFM